MPRLTRNKYIILLILTIMIYIFIDNKRLMVNYYEIENKKIPSEFSGYKIVQLSDLHNKEFGKDSRRLIKKIRSLDPDMIAITGDFIDSRSTNLEVVLKLIEGLKDYPIYYVAGNHESRIDEYPVFEKKLNKLGVNILNDTYRIIDREASSINLVGMLDPAFKGKIDALATLDRNISKLEDNYTICLSHRPEFFSNYKLQEIDLTLTGHTHGGQIRLPFIGGIVAPNQGFFPTYIDGVYVEGESTMVVSRGLGNSLIPFRLFNRSEIVFIELKTK